jgi:hypothetical protein
VKPGATLARAELALSEGDVDTALDALASYAEQRARGEGEQEHDGRWSELTELAVEITNHPMNREGE